MEVKFIIFKKKTDEVVKVYTANQCPSPFKLYEFLKENAGFDPDLHDVYSLQLLA